MLCSNSCLHMANSNLAFRNFLDIFFQICLIHCWLNLYVGNADAELYSDYTLTWNLCRAGRKVTWSPTSTQGRAPNSLFLCPSTKLKMISCITQCGTLEPSGLSSRLELENHSLLSCHQLRKVRDQGHGFLQCIVLLWDSLVHLLTMLTMQDTSIPRTKETVAKSFLNYLLPRDGKTNMLLILN